MKFDPTRNYFIVGNGKTMTIRDRGVFYELGSSGENYRKPKRAIHSKNVFGNTGTQAAIGFAYQHFSGPKQLLCFENILHSTCLSSCTCDTTTD